MQRVVFALTPLVFFYLSSCAPKKSFQNTNVIVTPVGVGSADEAKPPFVDLPHLELAPAANLPTGSNADTGTVEPGKGQLGIDSAATCDTYLEKYWKVGAQTIEEAAGPFSTRITFTTKVLSRNGHQVVVHTLLQTPDSSQNIDEQITFDACTDGAKIAIPTSMNGCTTSAAGQENVLVQGRTYLAKIFRIGPCSSAAGKTYDTTVWRINEFPLWGIAKREVRGSIVPSLLGGLIAAQTTTSSFGQ